MLEDKVILSFLKKFNRYPFKVKLMGEEYLLGEGEPEFSVIIHKPIPLSALLTSTSIALGEAYMDGTLEIEGDLYAALNRFLSQIDEFDVNASALKKLIFSSNAKSHQEKEVQSHYDLGNDFYRLWLDETMSYSCGYFMNDDDTLYQAQQNKTNYILQKLHLEEGMTLLDIGCGWGHLLIQAAKKYGVYGTGITLSKEQYRGARDRIKAENLENMIRIERIDYRDITDYNERFDRVVSVGMLEHVGRENYPLFIQKVNQVLTDGGLFLLHFISSLKEHPGDPWIKKYIFPGGTIPSLREILSFAAEEGFHTIDVENWRLHYHKTLRYWERNFINQLETVRKTFDERFIRMWHLYLASCAATFHNGVIDVHQLLLSRDINNHLPMVRWY